ncbi:AraC family transcriptional regulator [Paenibacillus cremeus]|uniref:AraC family transcriptional regulator n=1 Tax=Paenibacillus cremeus TaxID=2163881 RepID=A0A559JHU3_9BACL|nr:AraC family transcriptional regulator [Paenibacillus cremeus]TVX99438.1 AraC family transcriptional regulator [Paenibacillus cremeus]
MDYEFLNGFSPKLLNVVTRDPGFWRDFSYRLMRERTSLHILAYVYGGSGKLQFGHREVGLRAGMVFQLWPGLRMVLETTAEDPICFYSVHFQYGVLHWDGVQATWRQGSGPLLIGDTIMNLEAAGPELREAFERLYRLWSEKDAGYEWESRVVMLEAVRLVAAGEARDSVGKGGSATAVREAIVYMKNHYSKEIGREDVARHVALSPAYLSSKFKKHTGSSPIQYLNKLRLDHAKQLLRQSEMPIRQVAEEVGFADSFYFSRLFTKETGMSPREYRKA